MRIGYLECFAGISGDMLLGSLIDVGVSPDLLQQTAKALNIGAELRIHYVDRSGIRATKVDVLEMGKLAEGANHDHEHNHEHAHAEEHTHDHEHGHSHSHAHSHAHDEPHTHEHQHEHGDHDHHHDAHSHDHVHGRTWKQIRELIQRTLLPEDARSLALATFELLAHAEAKIHDMAVEDVHFHEVGAVDTITDIVCAAVGLTSLRVDGWFASEVNVGSGFVECAHGTFPVPAPATAELLKGIPIYSAGPKKELVTPTGAAILRAMKCSYGEAPKFAADQIGYGAGSRNPERFPNALRLSLGESHEVVEVDNGANSDTVVVLECAIDDASPQIVAHTLDLAIENGALDVMAAPVAMKKGRLGTLLTILARPDDAPALEALVFRETTTLGIRRRSEQRTILDRSFAIVDTSYGKIRVKVAGRDNTTLNAMPEYEDCRRAAREHAVPLKAVMEAAMAAYFAACTNPAPEKTTA